VNQDKPPLAIFWYRRDLRVEDNAGLYHALKSGFPVLPVFIFDTKILNELPDKKDRRVAFIYQALQKLQHIFKLNGSSLLILHDTPLGAFNSLLKSFNVKAVYANEDYEPYAISRDNEIRNFLNENHLSFHTGKDQVIFEKNEILKLNGEAYTIFTPYANQWKQLFRQQEINYFSSEKHLSKLYKTLPFSFPSIEEIGFENVTVEEEVVNIKEDVVKLYHDTRNLPGVDGTSHASVQLRFGLVSIRYLANIGSKVNEVWLNELIWREFFMMILFHFPLVVNHNFKPKYDAIKWRNKENEFLHWCKGETGYPIVDAGMRQLNATGWMHNRVRMIVSGFLCKHLLIDWRWGEAYFAEKLLDYELASNNGNWQWAAGTGCDAAPYFRIFNPSVQIRKFDPKLVYIKKWIKDFRPGYLPEIVNHEFARKRALDVYKTALQER
jgi:deoxyribodipyrimidine photo-lyase